MWQGNIIPILRSGSCAWAIYPSANIARATKVVPGRSEKSSAGTIPRVNAHPGARALHPAWKADTRHDMTSCYKTLLPYAWYGTVWAVCTRPCAALPCRALPCHAMPARNSPPECSRAARLIVWLAGPLNPTFPRVPPPTCILSKTKVGRATPLELPASTPLVSPRRRARCWKRHRSVGLRVSNANVWQLRDGCQGRVPFLDRFPLSSPAWELRACHGQHTLCRREAKRDCQKFACACAAIVCCATPVRKPFHGP